MKAAPPPPPGAVRMARWLTLLGYAGLAATLALWYGVLLPSDVLPRYLVLALLLGPLLLPLRGLLAGRPYTHAWSGFLALAYVAHGIMELYANPAALPFAAAELVFAFDFFTGAALYARWRSRQLRAAAT